jgi:hypothetical protein
MRKEFHVASYPDNEITLTERSCAKDDERQGKNAIKRAIISASNFFSGFFNNKKIIIIYK